MNAANSRARKRRNPGGRAEEAGRPDDQVVIARGQRRVVADKLQAAFFPMRQIEGVEDRHRAHQTLDLMKAIVAPGLLLQALTTRYPDESQMEVAIASMEELLKREGESPQPLVASTAA